MEYQLVSVLRAMLSGGRSMALLLGRPHTTDAPSTPRNVIDVLVKLVRSPPDDEIERKSAGTRLIAERSSRRMPICSLVRW